MAHNEVRTTPPPSNRISEETPISQKMSGTAPFTSQIPAKQVSIEKRLAVETSGRYVGPMPVDEFLSTFLRANANHDTDLTGTFDEVAVVLDQEENNMYERFKEAIAPHVTGFKVVDSGSTSNKADVGQFKLKPDLTLYKEGSTYKGATDFSTMEMWIEFKSQPADEPFSDAGTFERDVEKGRETRGQLTSYALAQLGSQFRTFAFSVVIVRNMVRLMRWDRAGVVVTRQFDYIANPEHLINFFRRFSKLSDEDRGLDTTVTTADETNVDPETLSMASQALGSPEGTQLFCISVANDHPEEGASNNSQPLYYIGPRPTCPSVSLIGRATRAWPVYNSVTKKLVFLKDTWRIDSEDIETEGRIYRLLHSEKVKNVARLQRAGDVGSKTLTQTFIAKEWSHIENTFFGHIHYRLVLEDIGRKLTTFKSTKELVKVVKDAMEAHWLAYKNAGVLHRDISAGNIIIFVDEDRNPTGLLIDWDLSKDIKKTIKRRPDRTGTWQFMSAALLRDRHKVQDLTDDLESFLHVLMWTTVRYVPNSLSPERRNQYLIKLFDAYERIKGDIEGGDSKADKLGLGTYVPNCTLNSRSPLLDVLKKLSDAFRAVYEPEYTEEDFATNFPSMASTLFEGNKYMRLQRLERLSTSTWFINTMQETLEHEVWPDQDGSKEGLLSPSDGYSTRRQMENNSKKMARQELQSTSSYLPSRASQTSSKRARSPSLATPDINRTSKRSRSNTRAPGKAPDQE